MQDDLADHKRSCCHQGSHGSTTPAPEALKTLGDLGASQSAAEAVVDRSVADAAVTIA